MSEIDTYLKRLRSALRALPGEQADDIVREIRSHLVESVTRDGGADSELVTEAIARLGDPATLANAYVMDQLALRAEETRSPILLLRLVGAWATRSCAGVVALLLAVLGYSIALVGLGCALLKPFTPERIGLWIERVPPDDWSIQLGRVSGPPANAHEVLGWYIIPLGLIVGAGAFTATTRYLLGKVRKYRASRERSSSVSASGHLP